MNLDNAIFLDYTMYNQDEYAEAVARYQDSYIVEGFQMLGNELTAGTLFFKGWHLTFDPLVSYIADPVEGQTIYMEMSSTLGSKEEGILSTTYVPGEVSATILQASAFTGSNTMPLYTYTDGEWVLVSNGRIDSINDTKADLSNNLTLDGTNIYVDNPLGLDDNINNVLQDLADEVAALTGGGLTETQGDNRYERALNINNNYVNEDLAGLNMAQIVSLFSTAMDVSMSTDLGANTVVASCSQSDFSNLHDALNNLLNAFYGVTTTGILTFRYEAIYGSSTGGGQTLAVTINNGATFMFQYDNYGTNYLTTDSDAFQATKAYYGSIDTDYLNVRSSDNFLIRGSIDTPTVTSGIDFMNIDYSNGVNLFNISRNESSTLTGRQLRIYLRDRAEGAIQQGLEINGGETAGVVHRASGVNKRLAYASEVTRSLELQRSGLLIDINNIQEDMAIIEPARMSRLTKSLSAKEQLLQEVEKELATLNANIVKATLNGEQESEE